MSEFSPSRTAPQEQALFPQDFRIGEASPEELVQHLELANWTISALEQTIKTVGGEEAASKGEIAAPINPQDFLMFEGCQ